MRRLLAAVLTLHAATSRAQSRAAVEAPAPWRAQQALAAPAWLSLGLEHRSRLEHLTDDLRAAAPTPVTAWSLRTLASVEAQPGSFVFGVELEDARVFATPSASLNTTHVNPLELLRAYAGVRLEGLLVPGDVTTVTAGRQTLDLGSRRLLARNDFRNTINAFTGLHLAWAGPRGDELRAFAVVPVRRLPTEPTALAENRVAIDLENGDALLWGLFAASAPLPADVRLELYVLGLHERDGPGGPSANRQLVTPGFRLLRQPTVAGVEVQVEGMVQLGTSRSSAAADDQRTLQHLALSLHASGGYRFAAPWAPRLLAVYDYASGDEDPADERNGRFDPLFGARRFELGPTGLYGALARSNLSSAGLRLEVTPGPAFDAFVAVRRNWLASARDAWVTGALRDVTGRSGSLVGHQLEGRVRWHALPQNLVLDVGAAWLVRGDFARNAPGGRPDSSLLVYSQLTGTI